jgi:hypothetical protein
MCISTSSNPEIFQLNRNPHIPSSRRRPEALYNSEAGHLVTLPLIDPSADREERVLSASHWVTSFAVVKRLRPSPG